MDSDNSALALDEATLVFKERLSFWGINPFSPKSLDDMTTEKKYRVPVNRGPPRVLEIGCSNGSWCFKVKSEQPGWIVEGVDDTASLAMRQEWHSSKIKGITENSNSLY